MIRRQARERRQYIYAKTLEVQERQTYERKQQLKDALASGKALLTELRKDSKSLGKDLAYDEAQAGMCESRDSTKAVLTTPQSRQPTLTVNTLEREFSTRRSLSQHPETRVQNFYSSQRCVTTK